MRTLEDIKSMSAQDYSCGIVAHYKPLAELVKSHGFKTGIEVGTAYGNNALYLKEHSGVEKLVCIDPYIFYNAMPGFTCQEEYDTLYEYAKSRGLYIMRMPSYAFHFDWHLNEYDFVFIDGSHDYADVKFDIENFWSVVRPGGILCGHDYNIFEGVNKAVEEFGRTFSVLDGNIWVINKPL